MTWLQLRLDLPAQAVAAWEDRLLRAGAASVTCQDSADDPVLEPAPGETPLWRQTRVTGLFPADTDMDAVLGGFPPAALAGIRPRVEILEDRDWEREWMRHYRPMRFGRRLWICPSWIAPPEPGAVNLLLDPGLAFGTGTHPTTGLCLAELDALSLEGAAVVDYGCGSGILGLAALKLGAERVLAVDNDPQALAACRDNAQRNGIHGERLQVALPGEVPERRWHRGARVVVANILAGPLEALAATLTGLLAPGGTLLLSGLLDSQGEALVQCYAPWLDLAVVAERDGWICLRGSSAARD